MADDTVDVYCGFGPLLRGTKQGFPIARVAGFVCPSPTVRREQTHFPGGDHGKTPRNKGGSATGLSATDASDRAAAGDGWLYASGKRSRVLKDLGITFILIMVVG